MIIIKTQKDLDAMKIAGQISAEALAAGGAAVKPGITTREVDKVVHDYILKAGATPSFLGLYGFPNASLISINDEVIHGIPGDRVIEEGDIVCIDTGACISGFHGDNAATFPAGKVPTEVSQFLEVVKASLYAGIEMAVAGNRVGDISSAIENYNRSRGYGLLQNYTGHGIGREVHEDPNVPNVGRAGHGPRLQNGMTIAIEPMVTMGGDDVYELPNGWTIVTEDHTMGAHFEHTIAITPNGPLILTPALY